MIPATLATLGKFEIKIILDKGNDVTISFQDITNKTLSHDQDYIVDVVV